MLVCFACLHVRVIWVLPMFIYLRDLRARMLDMLSVLAYSRACMINCVTYVLGARCTLLSYLFLFQVLNLRNSYSERFICIAELNIFLVAFLYQLKRKQESQ